MANYDKFGEKFETWYCQWSNVYSTPMIKELKVSNLGKDSLLMNNVWEK